MPSEFSIAVLISGGGTTLKNLIAVHDSGQLDANISCVVSSSAKAKGIGYAETAGIPFSIVDYKNFDTGLAFSEAIFHECRRAKVDLIVMGGFLKRVTIPPDFANRIINIHPSLIPAFCGEGFYGARVHQGVIDYGCKVSGCTVHFVDDQYDHGPIIAQSVVDVPVGIDAKGLAQRVFEEECVVYPDVINQFAAGRVSLEGRTVTVGD